jgi:hypothetical protein
MMHMHIQHRQHRVWVTLNSVALDCRSDQWLTENEIGQVFDFEILSIALEFLHDEPLECNVVDLGVRVEKLEIDVDDALLKHDTRLDMKMVQRAPLKRNTYDITFVAVFFFLCLLLSFRHGGR